MNEIKNLKEKQINDFIYSIDTSEASTSEIKLGLKRFLGEEPAVKFNYNQTISINEKTGEKTRKDSELESIEITYTYVGDNDQPTFGSCKYII
jgi:hypothetical protein